MKTNIGLWIDHRKAVIVTTSREGQATSIIFSDTEKQPGRIDGERSTEAFKSNMIPPEDVVERRFEQHLNAFYDEVIDAIHDSEQLLIFGPGEAKGELEKRLHSKKPDAHRNVKIEAADKMTDNQISARVRDYFAVPGSVILM